MSTPLQIRNRDGQDEVYVDGEWFFVSQLARVGAVLSDGRDPRRARRLKLLRDEQPSAIATLAAFWFQDDLREQ